MIRGRPWTGNPEKRSPNRYVFIGEGLYYGAAAAHPRTKRVAMNIGEFLYTLLLVGVLWWAYHMLRPYF